MPLIYCPECSTQVSDQAPTCPKCAYPISKLNFNRSANPTITPKTTSILGVDISGLDSYYREEFTKIHESQGTYKGRWNWYAFLFTWIWCLTKGCYGYAIIILVTVVGLQFSRFKMFGLRGAELATVLGIFICIFMGVRGTWIYYNFKIKGKQFPN